jgi:hypothetical protein
VALPAPTAAAPIDCGIEVADVTELGAPTAVACSPVSGSRDVPNGARPTITFSRPMDATSITRLSFTLTRDGGTLVAATVSYNPTTLTATLTPAYPLDYSKLYTARVATTVRALDQQPLSAAVTWTFTTTGQAVTKRVNVGGAAYVSPSSGAFFLSDMPVSGSLTTSGGMNRTTGALVGGTSDPALYADEKVGYFTENIIIPNGTYDVRLHFAETQGYKPGRRVFHVDVLESPAIDLPYLDVAALAGQNTALVRTIFNVTTIAPVIRVRTTAFLGDPILAAVEVIPVTPRVAARTPGDAADGVGTTSTVRATFNRVMDASSISTATFTLTGPTGDAIAADVTYDPASRTATLTPSEPLASDTTYTAHVDGVRGSDGMAMDAASSWTFTTRS